MLPTHKPCATSWPLAPRGFQDPPSSVLGLASIHPAQNQVWLPLQVPSLSKVHPGPSLRKLTPTTQWGW